MNTLTKLALGLMDQLQPLPAIGIAEKTLTLLPATQTGGKPLMEALAARQSQREFSDIPLPAQTLSDLLWSAAGVNRTAHGGRTFPSAMNAQEVLLYVAMPEGLFLYDPIRHVMELVAARDVRRVTGYQDFVDAAALDLVFVADHTRMKLIPAAQREAFASVSAGAMAQNVYLYCASMGFSTVLRAWFDRHALSQAMGLGTDHQLLLSQTVGARKAI
jgi:nitroreductase